jgi:hypothetical protein
MLISGDDVVRWLAKASYGELVSVLRQGLSSHADGLDYDGERSIVHLSLAHFDGEEWEVSLAAAGAEQAYDGPLPDGEPWCQFGSCADCGLELVGAHKFVVCPNCDSVVYMT